MVEETTAYEVVSEAWQTSSEMMRVFEIVVAWISEIEHQELATSQLFSTIGHLQTNRIFKGQLTTYTLQ